jgi:hypothetical protein
MHGRRELKQTPQGRSAEIWENLIHLSFREKVHDGSEAQLVCDCPTIGHLPPSTNRNQRNWWLTTSSHPQEMWDYEG